MLPSRITLVAHTHWDREWYEPFEVFRAHLCDALDEALDQLEHDRRLSFTLDGQVAMVDDYLELRPDAEPRIRALVQAGRLHIGPWYTQADTLLGDGEAVIRNLALGIARAEALGGAMRLGYMPDQFGHAAQLPQILRMFGIEGAVLWRGIGPERPPAAFRWVAPDGSWVTTVWLPDGYGSGRRLPSDPVGFADAVDRAIERLGAWVGELPLLIPVGDDHVRLATWLPEAAAAVRARHPDLAVAIGGYQDHLPHLGEIDFLVHGELRSPAFAPVLAGVASARIREKQAAARATTLLLRYAEPLAALGQKDVARDLRERAWKLLLLNHAHDSAAGCGIDAAHEDVRARYRWAEQLAHAAIERALSKLRVECAAPHVVVFHPGPTTPVCIVEAQVPRSLAPPLVSVGPDGIARPVQLLGATETPPIFEGEFSAADLSQHLGGLDPKTPLFGRYLTGITISDQGAGRFRLDVGLGEAPPAPTALAADQEQVRSLLQKAERFHVVLHAEAPTRPVLIAAGPAAENSLFPVEIRGGEASMNGLVEASPSGIGAGPLSIAVEPDGTLLVRDARLETGPVRVSLLDEGDRGDLYHFDPVGPSLRPRLLHTEVIERGPLRARLRVDQEIELPVGLASDRKTRVRDTLRTRIATEVTLSAGSDRVELVTTLDNQVADHRLRAVIDLPFLVERLDVEHGLAVVRRPLDVASALGQGSERAAPTGQHHGFVDASDGKVGVALFSRGLPEHELVRDADGSHLALTLLRSVGWLSRGDLTVIDHAAGPIVPTPDAQEKGAHCFEYALVLHAGDWHAIAAGARRYAAPPRAVKPVGSVVVPPLPLVEIAPASVMVSAVMPAKGGGILIRVVNLSEQPVEARLRPARPIHHAIAVDPLERPQHRIEIEDGAAVLPLDPFKVATVILQ